MESTEGTNSYIVLYHDRFAFEPNRSVRMDESITERNKRSKEERDADMKEADRAVEKIRTGEEQITLPLSRVKKVEVIYSENITEKQKNMLGRALAGGIILGPFGAIIGALTGIGDKKKVEPFYLFIVYFINKDGKEDELVFSCHKIEKEVLEKMKYETHKIIEKGKEIDTEPYEL